MSGAPRLCLLTAHGHDTAEIMRQTGKAKTIIWRWQERFAAEGVAGLWRDKTRPSSIPPLPPALAERVLALTLAGPPLDVTHWTGTAMAKAVGISVSSVQHIWRAHGLQPHRVRQFKLSNDPQFVAKLRDIVGLYVNPPDHAIVLSIDEESQIQVADEEGTRRHDNPRLQTAPGPRPCSNVKLYRDVCLTFLNRVTKTRIYLFPMQSRPRRPQTIQSLMELGQ
jgi:hypothetical protein